MSWLSDRTGINIAIPNLAIPSVNLNPEKLWQDFTGVTATKDVNLASAEEAAKQKEFNKSEAELSWQRSEISAETDRKWQENMSNSAYQRAIVDMKKAGINPMLAYMQGGAGSGSGAQGQSSAASSTPARMERAPTSEALQNMVSSALQLRKQSKEIQVMDETVKNIKAQTASTGATAVDKNLTIGVKRQFMDLVSKISAKGKNWI